MIVLGVSSPVEKKSFGRPKAESWILASGTGSSSAFVFTFEQPNSKQARANMPAVIVGFRRDPLIEFCNFICTRRRLTRTL
jgi:hypothetical protein